MAEDNSSLPVKVLGNSSTIGLVTGTSLSPLVPVIMFITGVVGNVTALLVLLSSKKESRQTLFYRLVGLLAFIDLLGTITTSPVTFVQYSQFPNWYGGQNLCNYFSFMLIFFGLATMFIVSVMALDRYIALLHPYFYAGFMSKRKSCIILLALFTLSIVIAILPLTGVNKNVIHYPGTWCFFDFRSDDLAGKSFAYIYSLTGIIIIILITVSNLAVIFTLIDMRKSSKEIYCNKDELCRIDREVQMIVFLIGVVLIFIVCWAPLMVVVILCASGTVDLSDQLDILVIRLASLNQILDPLVYIILKKRHLLFCIRWVCKLFRKAKRTLTLQSTTVGTELPEAKKLSAIGLSDISVSFEKSLSSSYRQECTRL